MNQVYEEFEQELSEKRRRYAGRPAQEMADLFLLALEREELVAVGYRESLMARRLDAMALPEDVRELFSRALIWVWKDEEMHAIYIRGAILKLGGLPFRVRAFLRQTQGAVAGWAGSVRQHAAWSQAPVSRALATGATWLGMLLGRVPRAVRRHLDRSSFRDFCRFNVDAEKTAWLCWDRLAALAGECPGISPELIEDFGRIRRDESNHSEVFGILADSLDDQDRLAEGVTAEGIARRIEAVGEFFLPRARRSATIAGNPIGGGGRVWVIAGTDDQGKVACFRRLLEESCLRDQLTSRARFLRKEVRDLRVAIKPTFMLGYHRKDRSPLSDPLLTDELARYLRESGVGDVSVMEGRNIYDRFYGNRSVREVARYFQIGSPDYRVVDASEEQVEHPYFRGLAQYTVARTWKEADFRISLGKMRSHPVEFVLLTIGNVEWMGARCDEFLFVERQAHRETAIMSLIGEFPPHFALLDAYDVVPDGLVGVMGCPRPKTIRRFYAGVDALAVDLVAARHVGMKNPNQSSVLQAACHWFGDPSSSIEVIGSDEPVSEWRSPYHNELSALLAFLAYPIYVMGSGRGALFVPEMDEEAFPPLTPEGALLRSGRAAVRAVIGLRFRG